MQTISGLILLFIHLLICVLTWIGIRTHFLKGKRYLMVPVIFIPFFGVLCIGLLQLQFFLKKENSRPIGLEKLRINEEIYKNNVQIREKNDRDIVPLEEALLINEPELRRQLIMNILNDDPSRYMELLEKARLNEDVEVVHYAITAMVELSKDYDGRLQNMERTYAAAPDDPVVLDEYCDFMENYLRQGLLEKQMERMQRNQYTLLLRKKLKRNEDLHSCICLVDNLMEVEDYAGVQEILERMDRNWHRREEFWVRKILFLAAQKNGSEIRHTLKQMKEEHIYLSSQSKEVLAFWLDA